MAKFATFNKHDFNNGIDFVKKLCIDNSIICLQEHWLRTDRLHLLNNVALGFDSYALSSNPMIRFFHFMVGHLVVLPFW